MIKQKIFTNNYLGVRNIKPYSWILSSQVFLGLCLLFWFSPITNSFCKELDAAFFLMLNKSLLWDLNWQKFWGYLNHPHEAWLNLIVMLSINFLGIGCLKNKSKSNTLILVLYYWFFFQLVLLLTHGIFTDLLEVRRSSPSLNLAPYVQLSVTLDLPLKDFSENCFPAGHTLVAIYWFGFTKPYIKGILKFLMYLIVPLLILPRLFSGAHWLSDIIFTIAFSYMMLSLAKIILEKFINKNFILQLNAI